MRFLIVIGMKKFGILGEDGNSTTWDNRETKLEGVVMFYTGAFREGEIVYL